MPTILHNLLATTELHEPKDVATAASGKTYVADGAGSGDWKGLVMYGWEDYNNALSSQALTSGVWTNLLNDGAGTFTNTAYKLQGSTGVWDTTANEFDWAAGGASVGDFIELRLDIAVTVNTNNDDFELRMDMAVGGASPFTLPIDQRNIDIAGSQSVIRYVSFYIGSTDVLNNPGTLSIKANTAGDSVLVNGWLVRIVPRVGGYV